MKKKNWKNNYKYKCECLMINVEFPQFKIHNSQFSIVFIS